MVNTVQAKGKDKYQLSFTTVPGRMIKCSLQSDEEREKENFWTVVLDTINYIYCLKLV